MTLEVEKEDEVFVNLDSEVSGYDATEILCAVTDWVRESMPRIRRLYTFFDGRKAEKHMEGAGFSHAQDMEEGFWASEIKQK